MRPNRFKPTSILAVPKEARAQESEDSQYWKSLQFPVSLQESSTVVKVSLAPCKPFRVALVGSARIRLLDVESHEAVRTFAKFGGAKPTTAKLRQDGRLLVAGVEDGSARVYDVDSRTQLRSFRGHSASVRAVDFAADNRHLATFGDDNAVAVWDLAADQRVAHFDSQHTDYVKSGRCSAQTSEVLLSGSYDHTVRLWDRRDSGGGLMLTLDHGSPVEDVLFLPNESLIASTGGHEVRIWDLVAGGKLLAKLAPHNKTVTNLCLARDGHRLVTSSLDGHLKFVDLASFKCVHGIKFPSPILSAVVAPDDSFIVAGMSDGLVQFLHRREPPTEEEKRASMLAKPKFGYLKHMEFTAKPGDVVIEQYPARKEAKYDQHLRKFEHARALEEVTRPFYRNRPEVTHAVLLELKRRRALRPALAGREQKELSRIVAFVCRHLGDARFSEMLVEVADELLDLYGRELGSQPQLDRLFLDLKRCVYRETRHLRQLTSLQGALDLLLASTRARSGLTLRVEEEAIIREKKKQSHNQKEDLLSKGDSILDQILSP